MASEDVADDERVRALRRRALLAERLLLDLGSAEDGGIAAGKLVQALTSVAGSVGAELLRRPEDDGGEDGHADAGDAPSVVLARSGRLAAASAAPADEDGDDGPGRPPRHRAVDRTHRLELVVDGDTLPPVAVDRALAALGAILDRIDNEQRLLREARTDVLTGLMNRRAIDERLAAELSRLARGGGPLSVLVVDLDGFKRVNDTRGHAAGDQLLVQVAHTLRDVARTADDVGRLGGDEFALLLPMTDGDGAAVVARRLRVEIADLAEGLGASVGIATVDATGADGTGALPTGSELLGRADHAMYEAKRARGRSIVHARP